MLRLGLLGAVLLVPAVVALGQATAPSNAAEDAAHHATVQFEGGLLTVSAANASMSSVLREIARSTGMKISGSVPNDRVFGTYGPAEAQVVLSMLLDGTGLNMMVVSNEADKPLRLVLTARTGGATPPNPDEASTNGSEDDDAPSPQRGPLVQPQRFNREAAANGSQTNNGAGATAPTQPSEVTQPVVFPPIGTTTAPATATTTPVDPDDDSDTSTDKVKTPQQIFEQLQKLQQATPQTSGTDTTPQQ